MGIPEEPYRPPGLASSVSVGWQTERLRHSGFGISSFTIALLSGVMTVVVVVTAGILEARSPSGLDENSPVAILIGLAILAAIGLHFLGAALGVGGLVQRDRNRLFAILGLVFNGVALAGICGLMGIGLAG